MLQLIIGPMFSSKTSTLLTRLERAQIAGKRVILLRPNKDTREGLTHDDKPFKIEQLFVDKVFDLKHRYKYDVIGIDEAQFFNYPEFSTEIDTLAITHTVIACGLNGTSERTPFKSIQDLIPLCDTLSMLTAICTSCGSELGSFSYYTEGNKVSEVLVGGKGAYTALCRVCHAENTRHKLEETFDGYQPKG